MRPEEIQKSTPEEQTNTPEDAAARKKFRLDMRDKYREHATDLQRSLAEVQSAKYETAFYRLMQRSDTNSDLISAMNKFIDALDHRATFGREEEPLSPQAIERLTKFLEQGSDELWFLGAHNPEKIKE